MLSPTFNPQFAQALRDAMEHHPEDGRRRVAVFDADGTLWKGDIGEAFLRWLIAGRLLHNVDYAIDLYEDYEYRVSIDRTAGYIHAVALMAGLAEEQVRGWCSQMAYAWPNYRPEMKGLVDYVRGHGFEVWIVSASNKWIIAESAHYMGFNPGQTLGITLEVDNGFLTPSPVFPVTCHQGKVDAIEKYIGVRPMLGFGDSMGDKEMLEYCQFPFVIGELSKPTAALISHGNKLGWPVHLF